MALASEIGLSRWQHLQLMCTYQRLDVLQIDINPVDLDDQTIVLCMSVDDLPQSVSSVSKCLGDCASYCPFPPQQKWWEPGIARRPNTSDFNVDY